jgi:hypothetical protein
MPDTKYYERIDKTYPLVLYIATYAKSVRSVLRLFFALFPRDFAEKAVKTFD